MNVDAAMERLYQRVELVRGAGDRWRGQLCLMSFVALLAGEAHSDDPRTASRVIRRFGTVINDEMPVGIRQRLKPFAPRIVKTRDGCDQKRAHLLADAWQTEIVPQVLADFGDQACVTDRRTGAFLECPLVSTDAAWAVGLASAIARLIAYYAGRARYQQSDWYWLKSIDLLDRLCDVGADRARPPYSMDEVMVAMRVLDRSWNPQISLTAAALTRIRSLIPAGKG